MKRLEIKNITKKFGSTAALSNIDLLIEPGFIYGLLGRNGAGKTTLLNLVSNRLFPDQGEILVDGVSVLENDHVLSSIYCMAETNLFPENMKVSDAFKWTGEFYPSFEMDYARRLAGKFELDISKKIKSLSTGYASIFKFITALASNAEIILLDEPVLGMDANHRDLFYKELVANFSEHPRTFVISTHLIDEVADVLDEVIIIKDGCVLLSGSASDLVSRGYSVTGASDSVDLFIRNKRVLAVDSLGGMKTAYLLEDSAPDSVPADMVLARLDLQKLFIHLTNA